MDPRTPSNAKILHNKNSIILTIPSGLSEKAKSPSLKYPTLDLHLSMHPSVHTHAAYIAPKALPKLGGGGVPPWGPLMEFRRLSLPPMKAVALWASLVTSLEPHACPFFALLISRGLSQPHSWPLLTSFTRFFEVSKPQDLEKQ